MIQRAVVLFACAALALGGCAEQAPSGRADTSLREVAGEPGRGWGFLDKSLHTRENGYDQSRYVCNTVAANGATFHSIAGRVAWIDEAGALTETDLRSLPLSMPGLLFERNMLKGRCVDESE